VIAHDVTREQSERLAEAIDACRSDWESSLDSDKIAEAWLNRVAQDYPHASDPAVHSMLRTSFERACAWLDTDALGELGAKLGVCLSEDAHSKQWWGLRPWLGRAA